MHGVRITRVQFTVHCSTARNEPPGSCSCHEEQRGHAPRHRGQSRLTVLKLSRRRRALRHADRRATETTAAPRAGAAHSSPWTTYDQRTNVGEEVGGSGGHHHLQPKSNEHSSSSKSSRRSHRCCFVPASHRIASLASLDDYYD